MKIYISLSWKELISTGSYKAEFQLNQLLESTRDQALVS